MKLFKTLVAVLALSAVAIFLPQPAHADYPDKPITFIVPFGAGSSFDALARKLGQRWEKELKVPVVVKTLPGSGGRRGGIRIYKSKPDGYTIGWTHLVPFLSDQYLRGKKPSIDIRKVSIIYQISRSQFYVFVNKKLPYKSLADLKKAGKTFKFASTGIGSITWVQANALGATVGFPVKFVLGYKKLADGALAVAKGDAEAGVGSAGELGYTKLTNLGAPRVITAPPGTPESRLKVLRAAAIRAVKDKGFVDWATKTGYYMNPQGPEGTWKGLDAQANIFRELKLLVDKATRKK
jgi:tripartite-type tricarboxylate transporter receptor subunit TctC